MWYFLKCIPNHFSDTKKTMTQPYARTDDTGTDTDSAGNPKPLSKMKFVGQGLNPEDYEAGSDDEVSSAMSDDWDWRTHGSDHPLNITPEPKDVRTPPFFVTNNLELRNADEPVIKPIAPKASNAFAPTPSPKPAKKTKVSTAGSSQGKKTPVAPRKTKNGVVPEEEPPEEPNIQVEEVRSLIEVFIEKIDHLQAVCDRIEQKQTAVESQVGKRESNVAVR